MTGIDITVYAGDMASSGLQRERDGAGGGSKSWLVEIAQAMGNALDTKAAKLVELSKKLDGIAGTSFDDLQAAKEFQKPWPSSRPKARCSA